MHEERFMNWAGTARSDTPVVRPTSLEQLQRAVQEGAARGQVRVGGGHYSWSPLLPCDGAVVSVRALDRVLDLQRRPGGAILEVEAGMQMGTASAIAHQNGYTTISPTLFPEATIGGVVQTGSHGSDARVGCFADTVVSLRFVQADGSLREVGRGDPDFDAARVSLGLFGALYSVAFELEPSYRVRFDRRRVRARRMLDELDDLLATHDMLELYWYPGSEDVWIVSMDRTEDPVRREHDLRHRIQSALIPIMGERLLPPIARALPGRMKQLVPGVSGLFHDWRWVDDAARAQHYQTSYPRCWDLAYALPTAHARDAWRRTFELVADYADAGLYPVNGLVHSRFVGGTSAWLAPGGPAPTTQIEVACLFGSRTWSQFARDIEERWWELPDARPHWGKQFRRRRGLAERYPNLAAFEAARRRWDPDDVFRNDFLDRLLLDHADAREPAEPRQASA